MAPSAEAKGLMVWWAWVAGAAVVVLAWHSVAKIWKYGVATAWTKSVARKGSWTASLHHFVAMLERAAIVAEHGSASGPVAARKIRAVFGRYARRTGEVHDAEGKRSLRESVPVARSARYDLSFPAASRDAETSAIRVSTSSSSSTARSTVSRDDARRAFRARETWTADVIDRRSGEVIAVAGFASLADGVARGFHLAVKNDAEWRCLDEVFEASCRAARRLGCASVRVDVRADDGHNPRNNPDGIDDYDDGPLRAFLETRTDLKRVDDSLYSSIVGDLLACASPGGTTTKGGKHTVLRYAGPLLHK